MAGFSRVMDRVDLKGGQRNNAYIYRDPQKGGKWQLEFLNRETNKNHRFVLKRSDGGDPDPQQQERTKHWVWHKSVTSTSEPEPTEEKRSKS